MKSRCFVTLMVAVSMIILTSCRESRFTEVITPQEEPQPSIGNDREVFPLTLYAVHDNSINFSRDYTVASSLRHYQTDRGHHTDMWDYVTALIPAEERWMLSQFVIFQSDDIAGFVEPRDRALSSWQLGMGVDLRNIDANPTLRGEYAYVLMHEFAHLMSLNENQINGLLPSSQCMSLSINKGCSRDNAYIASYFNTFWEDIFDDFEKMNEDDFYEKYRSHFLTKYSATHPLEDFAEAFAFFIFKNEKPAPTDVANEKIGFFYDYRELRELRDEIRLNGGRAAFNLREVPEMRCSVRPWITRIHN